MKVHFVAAIEAIPRHCNLARLWAFSIRRFGGAASSSRISVVFNDRVHDAAARLLERESDVAVEVRPRVSRYSPHANKYNALFAKDLESADYAVLTDADVACVGDLDLLNLELRERPAFAAAPELLYPELMSAPDLPAVLGYANLLRSFTGLSQAELERHAHPWFIEQNPWSRYPVFNGGMMCVRGDRVRAFREGVLRNTDRLWLAMRRIHPNPIRTLARAWNSRVASRSRAWSRWTAGYYFGQGFSDQVAIFPTVLQLGESYRVLPHCLNWRHPGTGHGEDDPPRLIHYYQLAFGLDLNRLLDPSWLESAPRPANSGQQRLAAAVREYLTFTDAPPIQ